MRTCLFVLATIVSISNANENIVVLLDTSGSMEQQMKSVNGKDYKINVARASLTSALAKLPSDTEIGVLTFDGWIYNLSPIHQVQLRNAIYNCSVGGGTPLGEYMKKAADALLEHRKKYHYGKYRLIVVTDGEANDEELVEKYLPDIIYRGIEVNAIGVNMDKTHTLATKVHTYKNANDPNALEKAVLEVFAETKSNDNADFDYINGLDGSIVVPVLKVLAEPKDYPIGEQPATEANEAVESVSTGPSLSPLGIFLTLLAIIGAIVFIAFFIIASSCRD